MFHKTATTAFYCKGLHNNVAAIALSMGQLYYNGSITMSLGIQSDVLKNIIHQLFIVQAELKICVTTLHNELFGDKVTYFVAVIRHYSKNKRFPPMA